MDQPLANADDATLKLQRTNEQAANGRQREGEDILPSVTSNSVEEMEKTPSVGGKLSAVDLDRKRNIN